MDTPKSCSEKKEKVVLKSEVERLTQLLVKPFKDPGKCVANLQATEDSVAAKLVAEKHFRKMTQEIELVEKDHTQTYKRVLLRRSTRTNCWLVWKWEWETPSASFIETSLACSTCRTDIRNCCRLYHVCKKKSTRWLQDSRRIVKTYFSVRIVIVRILLVTNTMLVRLGKVQSRKSIQSKNIMYEQTAQNGSFCEIGD